MSVPTNEAEIRSWVGSNRRNAKAALDVEHVQGGGVRPELMVWLMNITEGRYVEPTTG